MDGVEGAQHHLGDAPPQGVHVNAGGAQPTAKLRECDLRPAGLRIASRHVLGARAAVGAFLVVDRCVGEVREEVVPGVGPVERVGLGREAREALAVDVCLERLEGGDEHVQPEVELVPVEQEGVGHILLDDLRAEDGGWTTG